MHSNGILSSFCHAFASHTALRHLQRLCLRSRTCTHTSAAASKEARRGASNPLQSMLRHQPHARMSFSQEVSFGTSQRLFHAASGAMAPRTPASTLASGLITSTRPVLRSADGRRQPVQHNSIVRKGGAWEAASIDPAHAASKMPRETC
eukprot:6197254-Pleurochrysis_carterae.AAC.1